MLKLITRGALSSAFTTFLLGVVVMTFVLDLVFGSLVMRGLRPWKDMLDGERWELWCLWRVGEKVGVENKVEEEAAICEFNLGRSRYAKIIMRN